MIIRNNTEGYGYKYASLADIAEQGVEIPKMKTGTEDGVEYIYYYDADLKEWVRGARVVVPENKGMNKAQLYASAVTYARRLTVQMAQGIACTDDEAIEDTDDQGETKQGKKGPKIASEKQIEYLLKLYPKADIDAIVSHYKLESINDLPADIASKYINEKHKKGDNYAQN